jgi:Holliday junction resolvasome RuvABC DNA-binding subunit
MTKAASTPRVRAYRERRRLGIRCVKVPVSRTVIEALVQMGYLPEALQQDVRAIQEAVQTYVADAPRSCRNSVAEASLQPARGFSVV